MNAAEFGLSDTINVEHVFTFKLGDKWDKPLRKAAESFADVGYHWAESFRILAMGMSAFFVLTGLARLVAATKSSDDSPGIAKIRPSQNSTGSSRSKTSSSSRDKSKTTTTKGGGKEDSSKVEAKKEDSVDAKSSGKV